jgi:hypothetical protein
VAQAALLSTVAEPMLKDWPVTSSGAIDSRFITIEVQDHARIGNGAA